MWITAESVISFTAFSSYSPEFTMTSDADASFSRKIPQPANAFSYFVSMNTFAFLDGGTFISARRTLITVTASMIFCISPSASGKESAESYSG